MIKPPMTIIAMTRHLLSVSFLDILGTSKIGIPYLQNANFMQLSQLENAVCTSEILPFVEETRSSLLSSTALSITGRMAAAR